MLTGFEEKEKPENALFSGFLASPARFERAAFRLGELALAVTNKPRRCLVFLDFSSNLGKNQYCLLCSFKALFSG